MKQDYQIWIESIPANNRIYILTASTSKRQMSKEYTVNLAKENIWSVTDGGGGLIPTAEIIRKVMHNEWPWKGYNYHWLSLTQNNPVTE